MSVWPALLKMSGEKQNIKMQTLNGMMHVRDPTHSMSRKIMHHPKSGTPMAIPAVAARMNIFTIIKLAFILVQIVTY